MFKSCKRLLPAKHAYTNSADPDQTDQGFPGLLFCQHFCEFKPTFHLRVSCLPNRPRQKCRPRSDSFSSCSLIRVFPVCYSDSIFVNSNPENQHFIRELVARQIMQTQIRQFLKLQSDQSLHCLLFCQHFCEFKPTFYLRTSCLRYSPRQTEQIQIRQLLN